MKKIFIAVLTTVLTAASASTAMAHSTQSQPKLQEPQKAKLTKKPVKATKKTLKKQTSKKQAKRPIKKQLPNLKKTPKIIES